MEKHVNKFKKNFKLKKRPFSICKQKFVDLICVQIRHSRLPQDNKSGNKFSAVRPIEVKVLSFKNFTNFVSGPWKTFSLLGEFEYSQVL